MSTDKAHREKMEVLSELMRLQKESKRRDVIVLVVSIIVNLVVSLVIKFL